MSKVVARSKAQKGFKSVEGVPLGFLKIHFFAKCQKQLKKGPFEDIKKI